MSTIIKWGIIGLGKIAHKFAHDLLLSEGAALKAVASRSHEKAEAFAQKYAAQRYYGSYQELADDPAIDVVYIATPHPLHIENTRMCLESGKAVLCEKPMGMNAGELSEMVKLARRKKLFLMEGIWTRFMPSTLKLLELLESGVIGKVKHIRADFGFVAPFDPDERLFSKQLGGGSLLDIGIYPVFLAQLLLGQPRQIKAAARMASTGVDSHCSMIFSYGDQALASLESTFENNTPTEALIYGEKGSIKMHHRFHQSEQLTLEVNGNQESFDLPYHGNGYTHEIEEVQNCLKLGQCESDSLPLNFSLQLAELLDQVKVEIQLNYE